MALITNRSVVGLLEKASQRGQSAGWQGNSNDAVGASAQGQVLLFRGSKVPLLMCSTKRTEREASK